MNEVYMTEILTRRHEILVLAFWVIGATLGIGFLVLLVKLWLKGDF